MPDANAEPHTRYLHIQIGDVWSSCYAAISDACPAGFSRFELFPPDEQRHPTPLGHRYMADIAVHLLQQTYIDSVLAPLDEQTLQQHPLAKVSCCAYMPLRYQQNLLLAGLDVGHVIWMLFVLLRYRSPDVHTFGCATAAGSTISDPAQQLEHVNKCLTRFDFALLSCI